VRQKEDAFFRRPVALVLSILFVALLVASLLMGLSSGAAGTPPVGE
jgi:hypothetical protein